jgi:hypothetical protein
MKKSRIGDILNVYVIIYLLSNGGDKTVPKNQSTEGAGFVWVSECQKGEGCEIINQFVFV